MALHQTRITEFVHDILHKYLCVSTNVKPQDWNGFLTDLQSKTKWIQKTSMCVMQAEFTVNAIFVGPIEATDIVVAGFETVDVHSKRLTQTVADDDENNVHLFS